MYKHSIFLKKKNIQFYTFFYVKEGEGWGRRMEEEVKRRKRGVRKSVEGRAREWKGELTKGRGFQCSPAPGAYAVETVCTSECRWARRGEPAVPGSLPKWEHRTVLWVRYAKRPIFHATWSNMQTDNIIGCLMKETVIVFLSWRTNCWTLKDTVGLVNWFVCTLRVVQFSILLCSELNVTDNSVMRCICTSRVVWFFYYHDSSWIFSVRKLLYM